MSRNLRTLLVCCLAVVAMAAAAVAQNYAPRQYYSDWKKAPQGNHFVRNYYFKPTPTYAGYRVHQVHHFPAKPKHHYFYNPKTQKYWGRCPSDNYEGKPLYSLLKMEDRHKDIEKIPEAAFPPPGKLPPIPDSDPAEGANLDLPPEDTPSIPAQ